MTFASPPLLVCVYFPLKLQSIQPPPRRGEHHVRLLRHKLSRAISQPRGFSLRRKKTSSSWRPCPCGRATGRGAVRRCLRGGCGSGRRFFFFAAQRKAARLRKCLMTAYARCLSATGGSLGARRAHPPQGPQDEHRANHRVRLAMLRFFCGAKKGAAPQPQRAQPELVQPQPQVPEPGPQPPAPPPPRLCMICPLPEH